MSDAEDILLSGWLKKKGDKGLIKGWKNRWFQVRLAIFVNLLLFGRHSHLIMSPTLSNHAFCNVGERWPNLLLQGERRCTAYGFY
jgi:hypothetical protein